MKKKFLALALAAAVMAPTTSAFASQTIGNTGAAEKYEADVRVDGEIRKGDGSSATGKIEVELPLATSFVVDGTGTFTSSPFEVSNRGGTDVTLKFAKFTESNPNGDIVIEKTLEAGNTEQFARNNIRLGLRHTINGASDVFELSSETPETEIGNIEAGREATLQILGIAGTKKNDGAEAIERDGATEQFTVKFKIQKA